MSKRAAESVNGCVIYVTNALISMRATIQNEPGDVLCLPRRGTHSLTKHLGCFFFFSIATPGKNGNTASRFLPRWADGGHACMTASAALTDLVSHVCIKGDTAAAYMRAYGWQRVS